MATQHEVGRRHRGMIEDEDAAIGKLGEGAFHLGTWYRLASAHCLLTFLVLHILGRVRRCGLLAHLGGRACILAARCARRWRCGPRRRSHGVSLSLSPNTAPLAARKLTSSLVVSHSVFSKTKDYVSEFSRYKDPNTIREIRE